MAVPLAVALLALSTLGIAATTLETTVTTDPDEAIDPPWEALPISQETAAAIQSEMRAGNDGTSDGDAADDAGGGTTDRAAGGAASTAGGSVAAAGAAATAPSQSPLDRLLAMLATLLRILLGVGIVGGIAGFAYRYRGQHRSLFGRTPGGDTQAVQPPAAVPWPPSEPTTAVDRAWVQLVGRLDPDRPETMTPTDCRQRARRAGLESTAVEAITTAFERVHYGGQSPESEESRAKDGLDQLTDTDRSTNTNRSTEAGLDASDDNRSTEGSV
jgi:hypothetical protein